LANYKHKYWIIQIIVVGEFSYLVSLNYKERSLYFELSTIFQIKLIQVNLFCITK